MTLSIIFDKDIQHVLMRLHHKQGMYNYIGGHVAHGESEQDASYRELEEETGITRDDVELQFVRREAVSRNNCLPGNNTWSLYITTGVLNKEVSLSEECNKLVWVSLTDLDRILYNSFGNGNCYTYLLEALSVLSN